MLLGFDEEIDVGLFDMSRDEYLYPTLTNVAIIEQYETAPGHTKYLFRIKLEDPDRPTNVLTMLLWGLDMAGAGFQYVMSPEEDPDALFVFVPLA